MIDPAAARFINESVASVKGGRGLSTGLKDPEIIQMLAMMTLEEIGFFIERFLFEAFLRSNVNNLSIKPEGLYLVIYPDEDKKYEFVLGQDVFFTDFSMPSYKQLFSSYMWNGLVCFKKKKVYVNFDDHVENTLKEIIDRVLAYVRVISAKMIPFDDASIHGVSLFSIKFLAAYVMIERMQSVSRLAFLKYENAPDVLVDEEMRKLHRLEKMIDAIRSHIKS